MSVRALRHAAQAAALVALALLATPRVAVADYAFHVPTVLLEAWIEPDGSVTLDYTFTFETLAGAKPLDGVDVGMPTTQWRLDRVRATLDGRPLRPAKSKYVDNAIGADFDRPLKSGTPAEVRVRAEAVRGLMFRDTTDESMVAVRLTPTWFGREYVRGESFVRVALHLPPGVDVAALKWHAVQWVGQTTIEATAERPEHAAVVWERTYSFTGPWQLGISFPLAASATEQAAGGSAGTPRAPAGGRPVVADVQDVTTWDLFVTWARQPEIHLAALAVFLVAFSVVFFWATRMTGCVVWGLAVLLLACVPPPLEWALFPLLILTVVLVARARRRARRAYVPAVASVEGGGIKRGLTAPEAASLLEAPPEKILLLTLYGLSRKGAIEVEATDGKSLRARTVAGYGHSPDLDLRRAAEKAVVIHPYESKFLALLRGDSLQDVGRMDWREALKGIARHAASRLQGYDLGETREYYRRIVARAWKEAAGIGDVQLRTEAVDRTFDWLALDPNAWKRMDSWHRAGWHYDNPWLGGHRIPASAGAATATAPGPSKPPPLSGAPKASDVAGSLGGRLESVASSFASSLGLGSAPKGVLSGFDKSTAAAFESAMKELSKPSTGGGGGGGGGFSCACACAGCACACACAGGGR